jgi:hypothetical protein
VLPDEVSEPALVGAGAPAVSSLIDDDEASTDG